MAKNEVNMYEFGSYIAEIYDQSETYTDDVDLILKLIGDRSNLTILEPFCGTGRIAVPLSNAGHIITGFDSSPAMLERAEQKIGHESKLELVLKNAVDDEWGTGYDLVILGANCFYELAVPEEQEMMIRKAANCLKPKGYLFIDSNFMEGVLDEGWKQKGLRRKSLCGIAEDGSDVVTEMEIVDFDEKSKTTVFRRYITVTGKDGQMMTKEFIQQKHPVSNTELESWLEMYGLKVIEHFGDRSGKPFTKESNRTIFWVQK